MNQSFEISLVENWAEEMQQQMDLYKEPFLEEKTINIIKIACDTFKQDLQVFFMSVDIVEQYIYLKELRREKIKDSLLAVSVTIFITSKYFGGGADLKLPLIEKFLLRLTGQKYSRKTLMASEQEILKNFDYKLPFTTILDHFDTFFEKFMREYRLKIVLRPLCIEILVLLYCTRRKWFIDLKNFYQGEFKTFQCLVCSKLYLPAGILISALKTTNYQFILDIDGVLQDLKLFSKIHPDHINVLSATILNIMKK